jgi:hypothetical protein
MEVIPMTQGSNKAVICSSNDDGSANAYTLLPIRPLLNKFSVLTQQFYEWYTDYRRQVDE